MPKPVRKPWSRSTPTVGWLTVEVQHADLGVGRLVAEGGCGPLADQFAGQEVVGGEGRVGGVDRVERRVERDHQKTGVAGLLDGGDDGRGVGGGQQDALGAIGDAGLDGGDLGLVVAVDLAGIGLQFDAEFFGLGFSAFLHLHEERVGVGLGDQAGADTAINNSLLFSN
jgi:hypothetical protein